MKIVVCDDCVSELENITELLKHANTKTNLFCKAFQALSAFCATYQKAHRLMLLYNAVFLSNDIRISIPKKFKDFQTHYFEWMFNKKMRAT